MESGCFTDKDIQLLEHELFESKFENIFKTDALTAHLAANNAKHPSGIEGINDELLEELYLGFLHRFRKDY